MTDKPAMTAIRLAKRSDEDRVFELMLHAYEEQPIFPLAPEKMREKIRMCTDHKGGVLAVALATDGTIAGYLIASMAQYWYTDSWHLEELSNFVDPAHRKGTHHSRDLIEFIKWFAEKMEHPLLMGILSTQRLEAKIRLYRRQAVLAGAVFIHNTGHVDGLLSEMG